MFQQSETDFCSREGARKLKERIQEYWISRGFEPPEIKLVDAGFVAAMRSARLDIRSDLRNGIPARRLGE